MDLAFVVLNNKANVKLDGRLRNSMAMNLE